MDHLLDHEDRLVRDEDDSTDVPLRFVQVGQIERVIYHLVVVLPRSTETECGLGMAKNWIILSDLEFVVDVARIAEPLPTPLVPLDLIL